MSNNERTGRNMGCCMNMKNSSINNSDFINTAAVSLLQCAGGDRAHRLKGFQDSDTCLSGWHMLYIISQGPDI